MAGIITTLMLFVSVLAHELGHSFVALSQGLKVRGITLLLFGGVSKIEGEASRPRNEFLMAFAGPAVSLVIGIMLRAWWFAFHPTYEDQIKPFHGVIFFTGWMNILVAGFNMLPGYPMDGGRVLRSAVWGFTGDTVQASRVAYRVGRIVFYLLIGWGGYQVINGDVMGGLWIALIGWFLMSSARGEMRGEKAKREESAPVATDMMNFKVEIATHPMPPLVEGAWSVDQVITRGVPADPMASIPIARKGELMGFIVRQDLEDVPWPERSKTAVGDLMHAGSLRVISVNDPAREALQLMDKHRVSQLVVMDDDYVIGIVSRQNIIATLLDLRGGEESPWPTDSGTPV